MSLQNIKQITSISLRTNGHTVQLLFLRTQQQEIKKKKRSINFIGNVNAIDSCLFERKSSPLILNNLRL